MTEGVKLECGWPWPHSGLGPESGERKQAWGLREATGSGEVAGFRRRGCSGRPQSQEVQVRVDVPARISPL